MKVRRWRPKKKRGDLRREKTYFVLNGPLLEQDLCPSHHRGDRLFDRNNHKAAHHGALLLGGACDLPTTDRNAFG